MKKIFISYSTRDKDFVKKITDLLPKEVTWVDYIDLDLGDNIIDKIEKGIEEAVEFLLILSRNSLNSRWVKYESDMAMIRWVKEGKLKIKIVKIDDCVIPLRFQPFKYSSGIPLEDLPKQLVEHILEKDKELHISKFREFINRSYEIGKLQEYIYDDECRIIVLHGFYGIGKTTLLNEAAKRVWENPELIKIQLSESFFGSRLCLELCARAEIKLPSEHDKKDVIFERSLLAIEEILSKNKIVVLDDFQFVLNESGKPNSDILAMLEHVSNLEITKKIPVFIISSRKPELVSLPKERIRFLFAGSMDSKHIEMILKRELREPKKLETMEYTLKNRLINSLCGYPLAAKFAAPLIEEYSPEYILENIKYIKKLRIDLARVLLTNIKISPQHEEILELLAFCEDFLTVDEIQRTLKKPRDEILESIDFLVCYNFLEFNGIKLGLHPILRDLFSSKAITIGIIKNSSDEIIREFQTIFKETIVGSVEYVHWLSRLQKLLIITGKFEEAIKLWANCSGELKGAIRNLYYIKRNYELALDYCNIYLRENPEDFTIKLFKSKCHLQKMDFPVATQIIEEMMKTFPKNPVLIHHRGRIELKRKNFSKATQYFLEALSIDREYHSAIRDIGDSLMWEGNYVEAEKYLNEALEDRPLDQYILNLYGRLLGIQGRYEEAIDRMEKALGTMPDKPPFLHRLGWLYENLGQKGEALAYYDKAVKIDPNYFEARLSLLNLLIEINLPDKVSKEIEELSKLLVGRSLLVLDSLKAKYHLACGDIDGAIALSNSVLKTERSEITLGSAIRIELAMAEKMADQGLKIKGKQSLETAKNNYDELSRLNPKSRNLRIYKENIENIQKRI